MATPTNLPAAQTTGNVLTAAYVNDLRGAFRVLQVVYASTSTATTNITSTFADTTLTASITPQSTSNKVLVLVSQNGCFKSSADAENRMNLRLLRGATNIAAMSGALFLYTGSAISNGAAASISLLDSPASVASVTYKTQFMNPNNTASVIVQEGSAVSTMVLLEISA
jgi:hypothetical protein